MRELSDEEKELWRQVTEGMCEIPHSSVPKPLPKYRPKVRDVSFQPVLDLHFYTVQEAYLAVYEHIETAYILNVKWVQHITGKSGQISQEYATWAKSHPRVRKIESQNDGGAWKVWLARK